MVIGTERVTKSAPGGPRNSYLVVRGLSSASRRATGLEEDMAVVRKVAREDTRLTRRSEKHALK